MERGRLVRGVGQWLDRFEVELAESLKMAQHAGQLFLIEVDPGFIEFEPGEAGDMANLLS